jgi:hypothetical protein
MAEILVEDSKKERTWERKGEEMGAQLAPRKPVTVTVTLERASPLKYEMTSSDLPIKKVKHNGQDEPVLRFNNVDKDGNQNDGFEVTFNLVDQTGEGYGFFFANEHHPDPDDAIWVQKVESGGFCPTGPCKWAGFKPKDVTRQTLVVDNPNGHLQYFGFALLLSQAGETSPSVTIDPIGDNQNGLSSNSE